jgi:hypothetical protein
MLVCIMIGGRREFLRVSPLVAAAVATSIGRTALAAPLIQTVAEADFNVRKSLPMAIGPAKPPDA